VTQISDIIPEGSVSIEVYADEKTSAAEMMTQARQMNEWIPNAHIKFPTTKVGLLAAADCVKRGMSVNMTLVFTQEQAAAVYAATRGAIKGQVFVSPFIGRLDDKGENGMDLIKNILKMYEMGDGHVEVLTASVRTMNHYNAALALGSDIITGRAKLIKEWKEGGMTVPATYSYSPKDLKPIQDVQLDLNKDWQEFDISHELTDAVIEKFAADWNALIKVTS